MKELEKDINTIFRLGRACGLEFPDVNYRPATQDSLSQVASFGLPNRFSHWYFGGVYKNIKLQQDENLFSILELVLNTDPVYAFLLDTNSHLENVMVIAHVVGHVDFFTNNTWYARSDKNMLNRCEVHARTIRKLAEEHGKDKVDALIAAILTIAGSANVFELDPKKKARRIIYFLQDNLPIVCRSLKKSDPRYKGLVVADKLLEMLTAETDYFDLIGRTQIINEGWASFCEFKILEKHLNVNQWLDFTFLFSKRPAHYQIGFALFHANFALGGWERVLEIRKFYEDISFVDEYLTQELCEELHLFMRSADGKEPIKDVKLIKGKMIEDKLHKGQPPVLISDYDRKTRSLVLENQDAERTLDKKRTELYLKELRKVWPFDLGLVDHETIYKLTEKGFSSEKK